MKNENFFSRNGQRAFERESGRDDEGGREREWVD